MASPKLTVKPVTVETWPDLEALFEAKGGPKYCWCMAWREMANRTGADNAARKAALRARVEAGEPVGLVGYVDGEPVAWCSAGPRETFRRLRDDQDDGEAGVWSVTCFFVRRDRRGQGLSAQMLAAAEAEAKARGAKVLEAYPVDPDSPSYRFMGFVELYRQAGYEAVGRAGSRRHVVRRALD